MSSLTSSIHFHETKLTRSYTYIMSKRLTFYTECEASRPPREVIEDLCESLGSVSIFKLGPHPLRLPGAERRASLAFSTHCKVRRPPIEWWMSAHLKARSVNWVQGVVGVEH